MPWLQLFIQCRKLEAHNTENALLKAGALSVTLQELIAEGENEKPILEPGLNETPLWERVKLTGLFDAQCDTAKTIQTMNAQLKTAPEYRWEQLEDKDWEREWMSNYHPIEVSDSLWICPSWALLLGAQHADGVDIDPQALTATHDNVQRNGLEIAQFDVFLPQYYAPDHGVDIVLANILAGPLVDLKDAILAPLTFGGRLCLSGILSRQAEAVMAAYGDVIEFDPVAQKDDWVCLSGHRKTA